MSQSAWLRENDSFRTPGIRRFTYLSVVKLFMRYPIFLLALGPPLFRFHAIDATSGVIDFWSYLQVGWLLLVVIRAILRLTYAPFIVIPKQIRSVLRLALFLGLLFLISVAYSPSRPVSAAYAVFYFLTWICVIEFIADVYHSPPDWILCLLQFRLSALVLLMLVLLAIPFNLPGLVFFLGGHGLRLLGGAVAPMPVTCPIIAIISAYTYLYSLEPRTRAAFFFFVGLCATLATQSRGAEIALFIALLLIAMDWARTSRNAACMVIFGFMTFIVLGGVLLGAVGGERILDTFNRGQSTEGIESASGRTQIWSYVIHYCMAHPQGMGYIAGFRILFRSYFTLGLLVSGDRIGNTHNSFVQFLADAGWLALATYLAMLARVLALGLRFAKKHASVVLVSDSASCHALRCSLALLVYCLVEGFDTSEFATPLRIPFYIQSLIIAMILALCARMICASRLDTIDSR